MPLVDFRTQGKYIFCKKQLLAKCFCQLKYFFHKFLIFLCVFNFSASSEFCHELIFPPVLSFAVSLCFFHKIVISLRVCKILSPRVFN